MKFLRIGYHNYRCYKDDIVINFNTTDEKNIALIMAPNGGGKTEMLFSFWWVLYGFDFSTLKEKKDTDYSLNSDLYHKLETGPVDAKDYCYVQLLFEVDNIKYLLQRKETFIKKSSGIIPEQNLALIEYDKNGSKKLPLTDTTAIERIINKAIPKKILNGIIFDGERMKELSKVGNESREAIEGVIKDITNEELYQICRTELDSLKKKIAKEQKKLANDIPTTSLPSILADIEECEEETKKAKAKIQISQGELDKAAEDLADVLAELKADQTSHDNEIKRDGLRNKLTSENSHLESLTKLYANALEECYLLQCDKLFKDVEDLIKSVEIPDDLTVKTINSILHSKTGKCICGHDIGPAERAALEYWLDKLPPDNINSTLSQMIKSTRFEQSKVAKSIKDAYDLVVTSEKEIAETKSQISEISARIVGEGVTAKVKELEEKRSKLEIKIHECNVTIDSMNDTIDQNNKRLSYLDKQKKGYNENNEEYAFLNKEEEIINSYLDALNEIDKVNNKRALENINDKLDKAYQSLSEDYTLQKRIYIVQFDEKSKYRIVTYHQSNFDNKFNELLNNGQIDAMKEQGLSGEQIKEKIILTIKESNSTGQSKINTLSFAKAILDYSNEKRDEDSYEITKNYPFMIDSPFTELSDNNLFFSSRELHNFTGQIILMISGESYAGVAKQIDPFVGSKTVLKKVSGESRSILEK